MISGIAFDLDDTLYKEKHYVASGRAAVGRYLCDILGDPGFEEDAKVSDADPFDLMLMRIATNGTRPDIDISFLLHIYRSHMPLIWLDARTENLLGDLAKENEVELALITDGRSITQRNKIMALGLERFIKPSNILISEEIGYDKNHREPFEMITVLNPGVEQWIYVGDNPKKDFIWPNRLWGRSVMLLDPDKENIHSQELADFPDEYKPRYIINSLEEIKNFI